MVSKRVTGRATIVPALLIVIYSHKEWPYGEFCLGISVSLCPLLVSDPKVLCLGDLSYLSQSDSKTRGGIKNVEGE